MALPPTITDNTVTLTFGAAGQYYGYCTLADVNFEMPTKGSFTTLSNSIIAQEITYAAQELQEQLALKYQMPYVGTDGGILLRLRELNAKLAVANIMDRYFHGSVPNQSEAAAAFRAWVELMLTDVLKGNIQWSGAGFGDAVAMSEKPVYPLSAGATVLPDPNSGDDITSTPLFTMARFRYKRGTII
jgi:hypothetical protein